MTETEKPEGIYAISLSGFQVFDQRTHIPISALTLLYGPNSAGKSAVLDALQLLQKIYSNAYRLPHEQPPGPQDTLTFGNLKQHWRKVGPSISDYAPKLEMSASWRANAIFSVIIEQDIALPYTEGSDISYPNDGRVNQHESELLIGCTLAEGDDQDRPPINLHFELVVDSASLLSADEGEGWISINFAHPVLSGYSLPHELRSSMDLNADIFTDVSGLVTCKSLFFGFASGMGLFYLHAGMDQEMRAGVSNALQSIRRIWNAIIRNIVGSCGPATFTVVPASRAIPSSDNLTYWISGDQNSDDDIPGHLLELKSDPRFWELAHSISSDEAPPFNDGKLGRTINHFLLNHLFTEKGYRLDYKKYYFVKSDGAGDYKIEDNFNDRVVTLFLRNENNVRLSFEDVGSGLGYVFPVLVAAALKGVSFIQQPELHLHPALQAAMADIFIESFNSGGRLLIETHSEYLLLRLLKRIRQTSCQTASSPELRIRPSDLCVLFFDPKGDGSTAVKRLRITADGEFLDRWPRGFFEERDRDLFDE